MDWISGQWMEEKLLQRTGRCTWKGSKGDPCAAVVQPACEEDWEVREDEQFIQSKKEARETNENVIKSCDVSVSTGQKSRR